VKTKITDYLIYVAVVWLAMCHGSAYAMDLKFHGYFSSVAGRMSNDRLNYGDYDSSLSVDNETLLGIQMRMQVDEQLTVVGQWLGKADSGDEFDMEWAYADYGLSPASVLRIGKSRAPLYRYSESLNVSYSYPWIRPPAESYDLSSVIKINGLQYHYHRSLTQDLDFSSQIYYGGTRGHLPIPAEDGANLRKFAGIVATIENERALLRLGYHQSIIHAQLTALQPGSTTPNYYTIYGADSALMDDLSIDGKKGRFYGLALDINLNKWQWLTELAIVRLQRNLITTHRSWYSMLAYQLKPKWLVHFTYAKVKGDEHHADFQTILGPALQIALNDSLQAAEPRQHSLLTGVRYDLKQGVALKGEWQRFFVEDGHVGFVRGSSLKSDHVDFFNTAINLAF